ncbi:MAG: four-carbon acid sugar kinase family protein [Bacillota bacterium]
MLKTLIVADDNTGANASAILLKDLNFSTLSLINHEEAKVVKGYDGIAVGTDSRATDAQTAYERVSHVLKGFKDENPLVLNKRIDSTLRGNLGSELNAFKDAFPERKIAIVPSFPKSNRTCIGGKLYVNGVSLEKTDVAKDPKMPIATSDVKRLFKAQFKGSITNIQKDAYSSHQTLSETIKDAYKDADAIIFDAETDEDIENISQALLECNHALITVDPGVFTYAYTKAVLTNDPSQRKRYVFMVGSVTDTTHEQIKTACDTDVFDCIPLDPESFIEDEDAKKATAQALKAYDKSKKPYTILTTNAPSERKILDLFKIGQEKGISVDAISKKINDNLAYLLERLLEKHEDIGGVFSSGGDTTLSFLNRIQADGIELKHQVMPLCVYGSIVGGSYEGTPIITKGGMIGTETAYIEIKDFIEKVDNYG